MMHRRALGVAVLSLASSVLKGAEEPAAPASTRVRLSAPTLQRKPIVGLLVGADETSLRIERSGLKATIDTVVVPRAAMTTFEVSRRKSRKGLGAWIGALAGAGTAALILVGRDESIASCPPPPGWGLIGGGRPLPPCLDTPSDRRVPTAILAVPAGAIIGALVAPREKWEAVDPASLRVSVAPVVGGGASFRLVVSF